MEKSKTANNVASLQAGRIFNLMCYYLGAVMIIVILKGAKVLALSDSVVNVLLTTTAANIIGIFMIVAKYLFYRQSQPER